MGIAMQDSCVLLSAERSGRVGLQLAFTMAYESHSDLEFDGIAAEVSLMPHPPGQNRLCGIAANDLESL